MSSIIYLLQCSVADSNHYCGYGEVAGDHVRGHRVVHSIMVGTYYGCVGSSRNCNMPGEVLIDLLLLLPVFFL